MLRGYFLKKHEPVPFGIRRIIRYQLDFSLARLEKLREQPDKSVHEFRKCMKRLRALVKLIRDETGDNQYRDMNTVFRDTARELSAVRDIAVFRTLTRELMHDGSHGIDRKSLEILYRHYQNRYKNQASSVIHTGTIPEKLTHTIQILSDLPDRLRVVNDDFGVFRRGLQQIYRRGKNACTYATQFPTMEHFHELRKRVKDLWHASQILHPSWPDYMLMLTDTLKSASEHLGREHDLAVLQEYMKNEQVSGLDDIASQRLQRQIWMIRKKLQETILSQCALIYAESDKDFVSRIKTYWEIQHPESI